MIVGTVASVSTLLIKRRSLVEALDGRERRLQPRVAALAFQRVEQAGLLAADVGAGAAVDDERERVLGAEDPLADEARVARFAQRRVEHVGLEHVLAADVDERAVGPGRVGGDHDPLDQHVRALLHQFAVLERARLGLVGVADEVLVHRAFRQERDLLAHREPGAAAPAQAGGFELVQAPLRASSAGPCAATRSRRGARRRRACSARARRCP